MHGCTGVRTEQKYNASGHIIWERAIKMDRFYHKELNKSGPTTTVTTAIN